ncbi:MAG: hypothetical protein IH994_02510 [Proteobacteria bacterium]|nr:hypothetical protein [Pseudomonadota bacterium]
MVLYKRTIKRRQLDPIRTKLVALGPHLVRKDVYLDTIQARMNREDYYRALPKLRRWLPKKCHGQNLHVRDGLTHYIRIPQPTDHDLRVILEFAPSHAINRIDPASDIITDTQVTAYQLAKLMNDHALMKYRRSQRRNEYKTTIYFNARKQSARNLTIYADKPSRFTGEPGAHFEPRIKSKAACKRNGGESVGDNLEIADRSFLSDLQKKQVTFCYIDKEELDRAFKREAREIAKDFLAGYNDMGLDDFIAWRRDQIACDIHNQTPSNVEGDRLHEAAVQDFWDVVRERSLRRAIKTVDVWSLLPD